MKNQLAYFSALLILTACSFSKGVKKDFASGASTSYNGFAVETISVVDANDKTLTSNEVALDTKFSIVFEGIENYTLKNEKAFPGLSLQVTDAQGKGVINEGDLLASYTDGVSVEDASVLRGSVTVGDPMVSGQNYHCKIRIFDKNKAESEIVSEMEFKVK
jgi:hypothetical protein